MGTGEAFSEYRRWPNYDLSGIMKQKSKLMTRVVDFSWDEIFSDGRNMALGLVRILLALNEPEQLLRQS